MNSSPRGAIWLVFVILTLGCQDKKPAEIELTGPELSVEGILVALHDTVSLQTAVKNEHGELLDEIKVTYSSSQPNLIEVSPKGVLWCRDYGHVDVTILAEEVGIVVPVVCVDSRLVGFGKLLITDKDSEAAKIIKEYLNRWLIRKISNSN